MTKSIKGTQTEKNLLTSFAGESQARMRYTYFASVAKKEGYEQIAAIFTETAIRKKSMQNVCLSSLKEVWLKSLQAILPVLSVILFRICRLQRQANMKNGLWIIRILQMLQNRKVSQ